MPSGTSQEFIQIFLKEIAKRHILYFESLAFNLIAVLVKRRGGM